MSAVNEFALQDVIGEIYVAPRTNLTAEFKNDMTTAEAVLTELDALSYQRMASITDLSLSTNLSDNLVEIEADDTGTLKKFTRPQVNITGNWYEVGDIDTLKVLLNIDSAIISGTPDAVVTGWELSTRDLPELIVKIVATDLAGKVKTAYLYNAGLSGELVFSFLDVVRAGDLPASAFELQGNKGGFVYIRDERQA